MAQLVDVLIGQGQTAVHTARYLLKEKRPCLILSLKPNQLPEDLKHLYCNHVEDVLQYWLSPGVQPNDPVWSKLKAGVPVQLDIEYYLFNTTSQVIAVTGTNGKSSVCVYLQTMLSKMGYAVGIYGNYQPGLLQTLKQPLDYVILELSSFQLHYLSPQFRLSAAIITNIDQDHLEWHQGIKPYQATKQKMLQLSSICITEHDVKHFKDINSKNWNLAKLAVTALGYHIKQDQFLVQLPYRLQQYKQYPIYNDSKATNIHAVCAAIHQVSESYRGFILILAGVEKGCCTKVLQTYIRQFKIEVYMIGDNYQSLQDLSQKRFPDMVSCLSGIDLSRVILFSPGGSSYDQYKDFIDRGRHFDTIIQSLLERA
jgi:UDP-N-acetylmuramoylalanine--D-glutamate ligase